MKSREEVEYDQDLDIVLIQVELDQPVAKGGTYDLKIITISYDILHPLPKKIDIKDN